MANITATPLSGWKFDSWTGDASGTSKTVAILMDGDKSITANFSKMTYTLTISLTGTGTTDPITGAHAYDAGAVVNLTANPANGWKFTSWSGDVTATTSATTITMNSDKTIVANFSKISYQGTFTGTWSGLAINGETVSGTFSVTIDANGGVQGSFRKSDGSYSGIIAGQVDLEGNLIATGTALIGTLSMEISWKGKISVSGDSLSGQGSWSGSYGVGTFSGTGDVQEPLTVELSFLKANNTLGKYLIKSVFQWQGGSDGFYVESISISYRNDSLEEFFHQNWTADAIKKAWDGSNYINSGATKDWPVNVYRNDEINKITVKYTCTIKDTGGHTTELSITQSSQVSN
jgi:uncharacterized repeat protein (TIGR02543 family)